MNGGLNYQIEHHLFPRIHHSCYPQLAPIVRAYCESKALPYFHFPTITSNVRSLFDYLAELGQAQ
jgi:acyl-lipid (7-3)-desaturase (Delta-4 desaturase)